MTNFRSKIQAFVSTARPQQWLKNLALFAAVFFNGKLFDSHLFWVTSVGFLAFCLLSASNYYVNDIIDLPSDRKHPFKYRRPLARKIISEKTAYIITVATAFVGLGMSWILGPLFFVLAVLFLLSHYLNTIVLRNIRVVDIVTISLFYVLRVYAGQAATGQNISIWLILSVLSLALLLAAGKRRAEYMLIIKRHDKQFTDSSQHGKQRYSEKLLDAYTAMFASASFITYAYFTFLSNPMTVGLFMPTNTPFMYLFSARKWLMITVPFVLYGIMRYLQIIYAEPKDVLSKVLVTDRRLITSLILWVFSVFIIIYGFGGY